MDTADLKMPAVDIKGFVHKFHSHRSVVFRIVLSNAHQEKATNRNSRPC